MSGSRIHGDHPGCGDVEPPDLNPHRGGGDPDDDPETISEPGGQAAKKRTKDSADLAEEPYAGTGRSPKRPRLELENSNEDGNASPGLLSEKAKGKRPARSPEPEVLADPELDDVHESQSQPDKPPQTQFDDREQSPTVQPFTAYTCPICFGVVINATMTPW